MPASLIVYSGTWNSYTAGHLLRRTLFGFKKSELDQAVDSGLQDTLNQLLDTPIKILEEPVNYYFDSDPLTPLGESWVDKKYSVGKEYIRKNSFRAWRMGNMIDQDMTIHQKLQLFWFNHFAIELDIVNDSRGAYELSQLFYEEGLGSFKSLVEKVTVSQSMLIYLNGNTNTAVQPNENYARELFELFTVGKGPLKAEGDYTYYTEHDIREAAKVLSGFVTTKNPDKSVNYYSSRHNKETKQFSYIFNNKAIDNNEDAEYRDLIAMIFENDTAAKHICRKLYRWFVYYNITEEVENNIIAPLAKIMIDNNYAVKPVLRKLLSSEHFFDINLRGAMIKSPIDYTISLQRQLEVDFPYVEYYGALYRLWQVVYNSANLQLQSVTDPPDVAGWKAYYQKPAYYRIWISSVSLVERNKFSDKLLGNGYTRAGSKLVIDAFKVFDQFENKDNPNEVIRQFVELLLPIEYNTSLNDELKEVLIPGLPDFEWTVEYKNYANDATNPEKKNAVASKLLALIKAIKNLPQFQLS